MTVLSFQKEMILSFHHGEIYIKLYRPSNNKKNADAKRRGKGRRGVIQLPQIDCKTEQLGGQK